MDITSTDDCVGSGAFVVGPDGSGGGGHAVQLLKQTKPNMVSDDGIVTILSVNPSAFVFVHGSPPEKFS